jgi:hypothetical protein
LLCLRWVRFASNTDHCANIADPSVKARSDRAPLLVGALQVTVVYWRVAKFSLAAVQIEVISAGDSSRFQIATCAIDPLKPERVGPADTDRAGTVLSMHVERWMLVFVSQRTYRFNALLPKRCLGRQITF